MDHGYLIRLYRHMPNTVIKLTASLPCYILLNMSAIRRKVELPVKWKNQSAARDKNCLYSLHCALFRKSE